MQAARSRVIGIFRIFVSSRIDSLPHCWETKFRGELHLDFARLIGHQRAELDWRAMTERVRPRHHRALRLYLLAAEHWLGEPYPDELGRPLGGKAPLQLIALAQTGPRWYRFFSTLPRLRDLPKRLLTPSWYGMKLRALRRGEPW